MEAFLGKYTPERVLHKIRWDSRFSLSNYLDKKQRRFFQEKIQCPGRVKTPLLPDSRVYEGPWYDQGHEPTCAAWAVAHGVEVSKSRHCPNLLSVLLNKALGFERPNVTGLSVNQILETQDGRDSLPFQVIEPHQHEQLAKANGHNKKIEMNADLIKTCLVINQAL